LRKGFWLRRGQGFAQTPQFPAKKEKALFPRPPPSMAAGGLLMGDKKL
jgi:hypothetical protein